MKLVEAVKIRLAAEPAAQAVLNLGPFTNFSDLAGALFTTLCNSATIGGIVRDTYAALPSLIALSLYDISETARRNFEPGGETATFLFSRGVQAIMGHRIAHHIWQSGDQLTALALKAAFGRTFSTDIHPAAQIGRGLWLDHGLGFVVGETAVIEDDVSIWHNVTLGSTLTQSGPQRHPHIGRGAVIGAGAILLGHIKIGANANIAAGAIVVKDVPANTLVVGAKASERGSAKISFTK